MVFPNKFIKEITEILKKNNDIYKIIGFDPRENLKLIKIKIRCYLPVYKNIGIEVQIQPYLVGMYLDVEHDIIYKPYDIDPMKIIISGLKEFSKEVIKKLIEFSDNFDEKLKNL